MPPKPNTTNFNGRPNHKGGYGYPKRPNRVDPIQQDNNRPAPISELDLSEIDKLRQNIEKLNIDIELIKERLRVLESVGPAPTNSNNRDQKQSNNANKQDITSKKPFNKRRGFGKRSQSEQQQQQQSTQDQQPAPSTQSETAPNQQTDTSVPNNNIKVQKQSNQGGRRNNDRRRRNGGGPPIDRTNVMRPNDDSTTQAADPSSEERIEGEEERKKIYRRKKNRFNNNRQRGPFANRRRFDSSERNSNDTSPQAEAAEIDAEEVVQNAKRDFLHSEHSLELIHDHLMQGPTLMYEFCASILDHVICDVYSLAELTEVASRFNSMIFKEPTQHRESFVNALNNISSREEDIVIDAPRYMDSLGQFLAENCVLMFQKDEEACKSFLLACLDKYKPENRGCLLASVMKAIAETKDERYAKDLWNKVGLSWENYIPTDSLAEFFESNSSIQFTISDCLPEESTTTTTPDSKSLAQRLEVFADDITAMVERKKDPTELLERMSKEKEEFGSSDEVVYHGNMIYGIVRGCLIMLDNTSDGVKVDQELLSLYDSILGTQHEKQDEIALYALTLVTKLWYQHKCPKDMFINTLSALHCVHKTTTNTSLRRWLEDRDLHSIPGIGAARLHCKRFIDDVIGSS